ncbi:histidine phosphatase family protein [Caulobacter mirabilis]|uniref:Phosphoglycerate kinase n=1 Tax=Caulobacter mirabilis TaxID=69666 RepID=A0A2D2AYS4_9CAUL|nr:histidine phosphatase family protein [Caulobacter mirabilis]ATQ43144.1 phosphoglycerate kinase [Caulobacter mirabilis]
MRVYMIRHGKPSSTWGDADDDPGLDEAGLAQARAAADALLALPEGERPTRVVSSPLRRCRETAAPFAAALGVEVVVDPRVGEIPTPTAVAPADRSAWLRDAFAGRWGEIVGDLDYDAWRRSVASAVAGYAGAAVFSHYVAINAAVSTAEGHDLVMGFRPDHCSIQTFEADGEGALILIARGREAATQVL